MFERYEDLTGPGAAVVYMTNGRQLVQILESDQAGALAEDVCSYLLVPIEARDCCKAGERCEAGRWRPVTPADEALHKKLDNTKDGTP